MILVNGTPYRTNLPGTMQLHVIRRVKQETGLGWGTVQTFVTGLAGDELVGDLLADDRFLAWLWAWILNAGDEMNWEQVGQLTVDDIAFTKSNTANAPETGQELEQPDPRSAPTGSPPGGDAAGAAAGRRTKASTKTSKKPSTRASK